MKEKINRNPRNYNCAHADGHHLDRAIREGGADPNNFSGIADRATLRAITTPRKKSS